MTSSDFTDPLAEAKECRNCDGLGTVTDHMHTVDRLRELRVKCTWCDGRGKVSDESQ